MAAKRQPELLVVFLTNNSTLITFSVGVIVELNLPIVDIRWSLSWAYLRDVVF